MGAFLTEAFILAKVIVATILELSISKEKNSLIWVIGLFYCVIIVTYFCRKDFWRRIWILITSFRLDLLIISLSGALLVSSFGGIGVHFFKERIVSLSQLQLNVLIPLPIIVYISLILKKLQAEFKFLIKKDRSSFFMSDKEGENKNEDEFGFLDNAERFAESVFNNGSSDSLVFGIDAPWGTGKSTFVNLCKEYWDEKHKNEMIVYTFDLLRYENREYLLEKFLDGFILEIKNHVFVPEIESLVSKYSKLLKKSNPTFSFLGLRFGLPFNNNETMDDVFKRLDKILTNIDKKIVIIVDDLDRLDFSVIKEMLFVIKKVFTLPNISYVLCYDTENMTSLEQKDLNIEKITEFLEKFVNVKSSLYLDNDLLLKYFTQNKNRSKTKNPFVNPKLISKAVEGLQDIFESRDFHRYLPFIGDARKLKRLINTIILLEVETIDFENCDFDKRDLIHLLLIYINYPNIFRKIYNTETQGKKGFFSVVSQYEEGYPKSPKSDFREENVYKNSTKYDNYMETLSDNQRFILDKVFNVNHRLVDDRGVVLNSNRITKEMSTSYACFNGSIWGTGGRNLEQYLNLITKMSRPVTTEQYRYYINCQNSILSGKAVAEVFSQLTTESSKHQLWKVLVNTSRDKFTPEKSNEVISYALNILPQYSLLEVENIGVGLRNSLTFYIAKLLDEVGWSDEGGKYQNNTEENVREIAEWIFGEGAHVKEGVLDTLGNVNRGVMGLYDLLLFRLSCCKDRGGDIFNLSRSLSKHGNPQAPTSGNINKITIEEMREISQRVFQIFKSQFIDQNKNIFDEIDNLAMENVCGEHYDLIYTKSKSEEIKNIDVKFLALKSNMKAFIVYQLGNTIIDHGIGCGYYDTSGNKDEKGISNAINDYLFGYCFNPEKNERNYRHFLDYLLINFSHIIGLKGNFGYKPTIDEFLKVLHKDRLTNYWEKYNCSIRTQNFESEDRKVLTSNYVASYNLNLESTYEVLDAKLMEKE